MMHWNTNVLHGPASCVKWIWINGHLNDDISTCGTHSFSTDSRWVLLLASLITTGRWVFTERPGWPYTTHVSRCSELKLKFEVMAFERKTIPPPSPVHPSWWTWLIATEDVESKSLAVCFCCWSVESCHWILLTKYIVTGDNLAKSLKRGLSGTFSTLKKANVVQFWRNMFALSNSMCGCYCVGAVEVWPRCTMECLTDLPPTPRLRGKRGGKGAISAHRSTTSHLTQSAWPTYAAKPPAVLAHGLAWSVSPLRQCARAASVCRSVCPGQLHCTY